MTDTFAVEAFGYPKRNSIEAWYDWYVKDELRKSYWDQRLSHVQSPDEKSIASVANLLGDFPWGLEHLIVESLEGPALHQPMLSMILLPGRLSTTLSWIGEMMISWMSLPHMPSQKINPAWALRAIRPTG